MDPDRAKKKVIVDETLLLQLFRICRKDSCGAAVDPDEIKITRNGASIKIKACCNNSHVEYWSSSPDIGEGRGKYPVINVELVNNFFFVQIIISIGLFLDNLYLAMWTEHFSGMKEVCKSVLGLRKH